MTIGYLDKDDLVAGASVGLLAFVLLAARGLSYGHIEFLRQALHSICRRNRRRSRSHFTCILYGFLSVRRSC